MLELRLEKLQTLRELRKRQLELRRATARKQYATPGLLAAAIERGTVQTPALDLIDAALVDVAEGRCDRLIISMPPQEGKSTRVTTTTPLWLLLRNPDLRIAIASYGQDLAEEFGQAIRDFITGNSGEDGTLDLGLRIAPDNGAARRWKLDGHRGGVRSVGLSSGLTGRPVDVLFIDDPIKGQDDADSEVWRERVWKWWQTVGATRLAPGAPVVLVLTRWHEDDLAGRLLAAEDASRWRVINIPALADHDPAKGQADPLGRKPGEWLQSARGRTEQQWREIRVQAGSRAFTALYQGHPSPDKGNVWLRQWWRRYSVPLWSQHPDIPGAWIVAECDEVLISADMAFKDTKGSDYVAIGVWVRRGAQVFLVDQIRKRLSFTETLTAFSGLCAKWPQAAAKLVEDKANGTAVIDSLRKKIPGIIAVNPKESKYARAEAVAPFVEAGNVFLPDGEIALFDVDAFIDEAAGFPRAAHDDQVDQTSQALGRMLLRVGPGAAYLEAMKRRAAQSGLTVPPQTRSWRTARQSTRGEGAENGEAPQVSPGRPLPPPRR
ncbi:MAG TPA: phage terminase large subunit [Burkholderiaceae bacterium]